MCKSKVIPNSSILLENFKLNLDKNCGLVELLPTLKIINLSKWCLKRQVSKFANLNAIFLLDDSQMLITFYSD